MRVSLLSLVAFLMCAAFGCGIAERKGSTSVPEPEVSVLENGLRTWFFEAHNVPLVTVRLLFPAGSATDPAGKQGLAAITADMLDEGAGSRAALAIAEEIDFLGASLSIQTTKDYTSLTVQVLRRNLDAAIAILADLVRRPRFDRKEWDRIQSLAVNDLRQRRESATSVAGVVGARVFFGEGHPYAHPTDGFEASVAGLTLDEVREAWRRHYRPASGRFLVTGDLSSAQLTQLLGRHFGDWIAESVAPPRAEIRRAGRGPRLVVVDKPGAPQTVIRIYHDGTRFGSDENAAMRVASTILGGTFTSRLNSNLREDKKITYGARSVTSRLLGDSYHLGYAAVQSDATELGLREFRREYDAFRSGELREGELEKAQSSLHSRLVSALERQTSLLRTFEESCAQGSPAAERRGFYAEISRVGPEEVAAVCRKLEWSRATVVLVGDRAKIEASLPEELDLPKPEFRDRDGALIAKSTKDAE